MVSLPLFHIAWALGTNDERHACDEFFLDVFGAQTGFEVSISPDTADAGVDREESLMVVGNTMLIPIAPLGGGEVEGSNIGDMLRAHAKPGMWIGIALKVADVEAADKWLSGLGFHPWYRPGFEHIYFVLPRDETLGMRIEILKVSLPNDPRPKPSWDAAMASCVAVQRASGAFHVGIDLMFEPDLSAHRVIEGNAFGDLLPNLERDGLDVYGWQIARLLRA